MTEVVLPEGCVDPTVHPSFARSTTSPPWAASGRAGAVDTIAVVIPARNEQARIGRCLDSVRVAARQVARDVSVHTVVVLDGCTDATARLVARHPDVVTVVMDSGDLGRVRAAGVERAADAITSPAALAWLAQTDADSVVPPHWLQVQMDLASTGADLVLGTVEPEGEGAQVDARVGELWAAQHTLGEGHDAVHGANLGVRLSAYRSVGGYVRARHSEDVSLAERVRAAGFAWVATDRNRVLTSARRAGRAEHGFAQFLRHLDAVLDNVGDVRAVESLLREAVLDLARERGVEKTSCPSEAARAVDADGFRALMPLAREAAFTLADEGLVEITQRGERVDGRTARGPIRVRLVDNAGSRSDGA